MSASSVRWRHAGERGGGGGVSVLVEVRRRTVALPAAVEFVARYLSLKDEFKGSGDLMGVVEHTAL